MGTYEKASGLSGLHLEQLQIVNENSLTHMHQQSAHGPVFQTSKLEDECCLASWIDLPWIDSKQVSCMHACLAWSSLSIAAQWTGNSVAQDPPDATPVPIPLFMRMNNPGKQQTIVCNQPVF